MISFSFQQPNAFAHASSIAARQQQQKLNTNKQSNSTARKTSAIPITNQNEHFTTTTTATNRSLITNGSQNKRFHSSRRANEYATAARDSRDRNRTLAIENKAIADNEQTSVTATATSTFTSVANEENERRVSEILETVADGAFGTKMSKDEDLRTFENIKELETVNQIKPLSNPKIFGYYDVAYTKAGSRQDGAPAGGLFRSKLGQMIFKTEGLEQNLVEPNFVENRVAFELFGCLPGEVKLQGTFEQSKDHDNDGKTVRAQFNKPTFRISGLPAIPIGPKSEVILATTYIDNRVRLGLGGRGSRFVFKRKSKEQHDRDVQYWGVGGLAVFTNMISTVAMFFSARYYQMLGNRPGMTAILYGAAALMFAFTFILRHAGKKCEQDGWEAAPELSESAKAFLKGTREGKTENVFGRSNN